METLWAAMPIIEIFNFVVGLNGPSQSISLTILGNFTPLSGQVNQRSPKYLCEKNHTEARSINATPSEFFKI